MFIEKCALPVAQSFWEAHLAHGWRQEPRHSSPDVDYDALPLIPSPSNSSHSSDFNILGQPVGSLDQAILIQRTINSMVQFLPNDSMTSSIQWTHQQISLSRRTQSTLRDHTFDIISEITFKFL